MTPRLIEETIVANELNKVIRNGAFKTSLEQVPVLAFLIAPNIDEEFLNSNSLGSFIRDQVVRKITDTKSLRALLVLLGIEPDFIDCTATEREHESAEIFGISIEAFRKTHRKKLLKTLGVAINSSHNWIYSTHVQKNATMVITEENKKIIDQSTIGALDYILKNPQRVCTNYVYEAEIDYSFKAPRVVSEYRRKRLLPSLKKYSVFICKNYEAMHIAMQNEAIVGLEMAELSDDEWDANKENFVSNIVFQNKRLKPTSIEISDSIVQFDFQIENSPEQPADYIEIYCVYNIDRTINRFPVKLVNHFTLGSVNINFTIRGADITALHYSDFFAGFDGDKPFNDRIVTSRLLPLETQKHSIHIEVQPEILIWPGSGVEFFWELSEG